MSIQPPSKLAHTEQGPWVVSWAFTDGFRYEGGPLIFTDRRVMLNAIKAKILELRAGGFAARLHHFLVKKPGGLISVVPGLLREWDAQFRPVKPLKRPHGHPNKKRHLQVERMQEDFAYLHGVFDSLERLAGELRSAEELAACQPGLNVGARVRVFDCWPYEQSPAIQPTRDMQEGTVVRRYGKFLGGYFAPDLIDVRFDHNGLESRGHATGSAVLLAAGDMA